MAEGKSSRVFLISSLVLGILATITAFVYLENTSGGDGGRKIKILVAKHDLLEGSRIDANRDLAEKEFPADIKGGASGYLLAANRPSYMGERVNRTIYSDTPIYAADLAALPEVELAGQMRGMSIPVDGFNALVGVVQPGDLVKVAVTRGKEIEIVTPEPLRILAIGGHRTRTRVPITAAEQYMPQGSVSMKQAITLEVTEEQAKNLLQKTQGAVVSLLLCPKPATRPGR